jgi:hypothetical protein
LKRLKLHHTLPAIPVKSGTNRKPERHLNFFEISKEKQYLHKNPVLTDTYSRRSDG